MAIQMKLADRNVVVKVLADQAAASFTGPYQFFRSLNLQADLSNEMRNQVVAIGQGAPDIDALNLVQWALARDVNPQDPSYTTLGSILRVIVDSNLYGWETRRTLAVVIVAYRLYRDAATLTDLMTRFQIPHPPQGPGGAGDKGPPPLPMGGAGGPVAVGPDIQWRGGQDPDLALQSWPWSEPDYLDVGFLMRATDRAAAVCRVELPSLKRTGTGFLIASDLLLTNYHVLRYASDENMEANAADVTLRFGFITDAVGGSADGKPFRLAANPVVASSPIHELDFVLLRVESGVKNADGVKPLRAVAPAVGRDKSLNIIQHPEGQTLKIVLNSNGVNGVYQDSGLIQYVSRTAGGSSGSPCFNDAWELVALHHAERSRAFGSIREGILYSFIHVQIKNFLPA